MNKLERYMENLTHEALKDVLRFIFSTTDIQDCISNIEFIEAQVEEMSRMYPEYW